MSFAPCDRIMRPIFTPMPSLPLDLERMIFELAVFEDTDHDNRVRITLVAKRVYEWYVGDAH